MRRAEAVLVFALVSAPCHLAAAGTLPDIETSPSNVVPQCVTPGRLIDYLKSRNPELDARFDSVPVEYMRHGEKLGIRWDYAFYQMIVETGSLSYRRGNRAGDVRPAQNNFAGLGATGRGEHGESFKDIASGVRAHLEHLLLYAGHPVENPIAERTRKVHEWGVLTSWQQRFNRPITFSDLAAKWAPGSGGYAGMLEAVAERFQGFCTRPDPKPELVAEARGQKGRLVADARPPNGTQPEVKPVDRPTGADLARRAIEDSKTSTSEPRTLLGARQEVKSPPVPFKVLNTPDPAEAETATAPAADANARTKGPAAARTTTASVPAKGAQPDKPSFKTASAAGAAKSLTETPPPPAAGQKCRVWTASYGGQKALIIRSTIDKIVNYTVLDVNDGAEKREAEAFIAAYAKDGAIAGEFASQTQALDKAFELCPEG